MSAPDESRAILTDRLSLEPLRVDDADELAGVLGDERLHEFIGGRPLTAVELRERYAALVAGSPVPGEEWLNWTVRARANSEALGTLQATLRARGERRTAHVAWVIGVRWQGRGFASEAACALVEWLRARGVETVIAHVHPEHAASATVAARAGLRRTGERADGEDVWRTPEA